MITLPTAAQRHWVSAFGTTATVLLALTGATLGWLWSLAADGRPSGALTATAGVAAGLAVAVSLLGTPAARRRAYVVWARVSRKVSNLVAAYLTRLLFGVITVAGLGGSSFQVQAPRGARSNWTPKSPVPAEAYGSQHLEGDDGTGSWSRSYLSWAFGGGGPWLLILYPLIALLGLVQTREKGSFGGNVYTLY
jgi:hypothetical protein